MSVVELAATNLLSPMVLFFVLGLVATWARSDLNIPEAVAKGMSLYLMLAIGFKGGASVAAYGVDGQLVLSIIAGLLLSALIPIVAFQILLRVTSLPRVDAAAIAAHYGSISIVTFLAAIQVLDTAGIRYEGFMVATAAAMEVPAIIVALWLAKSGSITADSNGALGSGANVGVEVGSRLDAETLREVALNGSIVILVGSFVIGAITGQAGLKSIAPFIVDPFKGVLCLFLLDMGLIAGRGLRESRKYLTLPLVLFGLYMPLIGAVLGLAAAKLCGLSVGGMALFITLGASASYIAVPAALRLALPEARPSIYVPMSLGITFPFNLTLGIPLYISLATLFAR
ncbi:MAG: sodium-dependent bicarbonate transport family permease [Hyphomicrobium aestuarii]|nr:sodium-dependent bicarbonate transport family permease [Hyphomicrobium aestuarii]